jgi:hypothetical protein
MAKTTKEDSKVSAAEHWLDQISKAEDSFKQWFERGKKVVDRYRDDRDGTSRLKRKFNILWSNVQVLKPSLYGRMPKPEVSRRYDDQDPIGRISAQILERSLLYEVEQYPDFNHAMNGAVEDRLLPGRGTGWIRYEMGEQGQVDTGQVTEDQRSKLAYECAPCDYVSWQDYLHNPARTWDEVWWVARRVWLTKKEGTERFGEIFKTVPVEQKKDRTADKETPKDALSQKAQVWEIWNKAERKVIWIAKGFNRVLDERDDPLQLEGFFPCPKPLFATTTTGSLVAIPDYCEYQDQAEELDTITQRIHLLVRALKVRGVYNSEFKAIKRLLSETDDNELIPVDSWAAFAEKGGMKGAVDWMPIMEVAGVLEQLYMAREQVLNVIYQTMGLSDIMRGASKAQETLGAQQLKANFGSMRLRGPQEDVARFATDFLRMKAQIMCRFFSDETLIQMSGIKYTPEGQQPGVVEQALALLRQGPLRDFRISIESDTLAQIDQQQEKAEMVEFITGLGGMLKEAAAIIPAAPALMPAIGETILYAIRKQRAGKAVESAWENALKSTQEMMQKPQVDPAQIEQAKAELEQKGKEIEKGGMELEKKAMKVSMDEQMAIERINQATQKQVFEIEKARETALFQIEKARSAAEHQVREKEMATVSSLHQKERDAEFKVSERERQVDADASERERQIKAKQAEAKAQAKAAKGDKKAA